MPNSVFDSNVPDDQLVNQVLAGERQSFETLISRYDRLVFGLAWSELGSFDLAEEAAQQTFVKAYCYLATLRDPAKFRSWIATIASNISRTIRRKRAKELNNREQWELQPEARLQETPNNLTEELETSIGDLTENHRQVLTLFYLEGQSVKKVAESLGLSESAVKARLSRARAELRGELEKRLGDALEEIRPSHSLAPAIMAALPGSLPLGATLKLGPLNTVFGFLIKPLVGVVIQTLSFLPMWLMVSADSQSQAANFQEGEQHEFRRRLAKAHPVQLFIAIIVVLLVTGIVTNMFGIMGVFQLLAVYALYGISLALIQVRVNKSGFSLANLATIVLQFIAFVLIGFFEFHFGVFMIAMLVANVGLYLARDSMPSRRDYNLFLRAATGGLAPQAQADPLEKSISNDQLIEFAKFLGENWLIKHYRLRSSYLQLFLPCARTNFYREIFVLFSRLSTIEINAEGICRAWFTDNDIRDIEKLTAHNLNREELTEQVEHSVSTALRQFASGHHEQARKTLCYLSDEKVFKQKPSELRSRKWVYAVSIIAAAMGAIAFALSKGFGKF
ncbi:MAG: RNA polymerase sigma factor [Planctomycetaceae bacterium]|nr:RNA polymerase sigma factor [Planctomycetaceae bacterium]